MLVRQSNKCPLCETTPNPQYFGRHTSLHLSAKSQAFFVKCRGLAELLGDHASQARIIAVFYSASVPHSFLEEAE